MTVVKMHGMFVISLHGDLARWRTNIYRRLSFIVDRSATDFRRSRKSQIQPKRDKVELKIERKILISLRHNELTNNQKA